MFGRIRAALTVTRVVAALGVTAIGAGVLPAVLPTITSPSKPLQGIDFGWGGPSCSALHAAGIKFVASYLSHDPSKDFSAGSVARFHACGEATVAVYETSSTRATQGYSAGYADARYAARKLALLSAPSQQPFDMAIDCDCSGPQVASYFQGAQAAEPGRVNAYGGYWPLQWLCAHGLVGHRNWQTYAWSGGRWLPASCAPLEQYHNDVYIGGIDTDLDHAIAPDYGQWPGPAPAGPSRAQVKAWSRGRDSSLRAYYGQHCTQPVLGRTGCRVLSTRVVYFQSKLGRVACFGRHSAPRAPVCQIVRPEVAIWSRARDSSHKFHIKQRERYFAAKVRAAIRAWA